MSFPHYTQLDMMDCGPTCLRIIAQHYDCHYSLQSLRERCHITREGVSLLGISDAAESIGFRTIGVKITWEQLRDEANLPCIIHWNQRHFVVVYRIARRRGQWWFWVSDPAQGLLKYSERTVMERLFKNKTVVVVAHRLSTVRNADNIVVLDCGRIVEQGTHDELTAKKGYYYELVKNQLELGN